jgi:deazaflavin-dependent oxidoreductase (nitroreductase family)
MTARAAALLRVRWIVRAPLALYRARLGFVFGSRLLMLKHTGKKTGARRHVVLEVIGHPRPGSYLVVSEFGVRAPWFRNLRANPRVRVWISGHRPRPAIARPLSSGEAAAALTACAARHPRAWAALKSVLDATLGARIDDHHTSLPVIALDLTGHGAGPGAKRRLSFWALSHCVSAWSRNRAGVMRARSRSWTRPGRARPWSWPSRWACGTHCS